MQFNKTDSNTEVYGEVLSNRVGIDINNIDFIINILSTNLYSNPIESFLRETVSNAWDSHVEAGVKDLVVIEVGEEQNNYYCAIRDKGVGLSEERFNKIYRNIGSSTKRDTNEQIGGFGIGRFSALSYSNMVHITSIYNNIKYLYVMYKDGNNLSIDLMSKIPTEEHNGVEVKVLFPYSDTLNFIYAIQNQLCFFENLIFINLTKNTNLIKFEEDFNNLKIKKYKTFSVKNKFNENYYNCIQVLVGKVCYFIPYNNLNFQDLKIDSIKDGKIYINFNIGELDVTPNRESINFTKKSINAINEKIKLVLEEINDITINYCNKEFESIEEIEKYNIDNIPLMEINNTSGSPRIVIPYSTPLQFIYKGVLYNGRILKNLIQRLYLYDLYLHTYTISSSKSIIKTKRSKKSKIPIGNILFNYKNFIGPKLFNANYSTLNTYTKRYIGHIVNKEITKNPGFYFFLMNSSQIKSEKKTLIKYLYNCLLTSLGTIYKKEYRLIIKYTIDKLFKNLDTEINNSSVPLEFIEKVKEEKKKIRLENKINKVKNVSKDDTITVYRLRESYKGPEVTTDGKYLNLSKTPKGLVIYDKKNSNKLRELFSMLSTDAKIRKISFIEVSPSNVEKLNGLKNFVYMEDLIKGDFKLIRKIATIRLINNNIPYLRELSYIKNLDKISPKLAEAVTTLIDYNNLILFNTNQNDLHDEIYKLCVEKNYFDENIKSLIESNIKMIKSSEFLLHLKTDHYKNLTDESIKVAIDYILSKKLFLPNAESLKYRTKNIKDFYTLKY